MISKKVPRRFEGAAWVVLGINTRRVDMVSVADRPHLEVALQYAELGYKVFPCKPGQKTPITKNGRNDATTNQEQIKSWWKARPEANIGLATDGLMVIDIDGPKNPWPPNQDHALDLTSAPTSCTPSGGRHHVYRQPEGSEYRSTAGRLATKVDTRANGGYIVVPPSRLENGRQYAWIEGLELDQKLEKIPEPPAWLIQELDRLKEARKPGTGQQGAAGASIPNECVQVLDKGYITFANTTAPYQQMALELLEEAGWQLHHLAGDVLHLARPGKPTAEGSSATWNAPETRHKELGFPRLYVFTPNAPPFQAGENYSPFDVLELLCENWELEKRNIMNYYTFSKGFEEFTESESTGAPGSPDDEPRLALVDWPKIRPRPIQWLVEGLLPIGKLCALSGPGGASKSTFLRHVSACLISGRGNLAHTGGELFSVLWLRAEDGPDDQILPSLLAEGLSREEINRFHLVSQVEMGSRNQEPCANTATMKAVETHLENHPDCKLVVIDPLMDLLAPASLNPDKAEDIRRALRPLQVLAQKFNACVLLLTHDNKSREQAGAGKVAHSSQIVNTCRWVLKIEAYGEKRLVSLVKGNLPKSKMFRFMATLEPVEETEAKNLLQGIGEDPASWHSFEGFCRTSVEVLDEVNLRGILKDVEKTEKDKCSEWIIEQVKASQGIFAGILKRNANERGWSGGTWSEGLKTAIASGQIKKHGKARNTTYQPNQP